MSRRTDETKMQAVLRLLRYSVQSAGAIARAVGVSETYVSKINAAYKIRPPKGIGQEESLTTAFMAERDLTEQLAAYDEQDERIKMLRGYRVAADRMLQQFEKEQGARS